MNGVSELMWEITLKISEVLHKYDVVVELVHLRIEDPDD